MIRQIKCATLGLVTAFAGGCSLTKFFRRPPDFPAFTAPGVVQSGPAATPGESVTQKTSTLVPLIPGSVITISTARPDGGVSAISSAGGPGASVVFSTESAAIKTPTSFPPPAPPSPSEIAAGDGVKLFYWLAAGCAAAAIAAAYFAHLKAAALLVSASVGIPVVLKLFGAIAASHWGTFFIAAALALFAAWEFVKHRVQPAP